jgi:hypothetical protein
MLYSIGSERSRIEEMDYNLLFRWFLGLNADDEVWDASAFSKNRGRLTEPDVAKQLLALMRRVRHCGMPKVDWTFTFACAAYNLARMRNLAAPVLAA